MLSRTQRKENVLKHFGYEDIQKLFLDLYVDKKMSCLDIARYIYSETQEKYSSQYIRNIVKMNGMIRERAQAYELMKLGNGDYKSPLIKTVNEKPITLSKRFRVMQKNNFVCSNCGTREFINLYRIQEDYPYGKNNDFNLTIACPKCAEEKGYTLTENFEQDTIAVKLGTQTKEPTNTLATTNI
jgi:hypothetical protein